MKRKLSGPRQDTANLEDNPPEKTSKRLRIHNYIKDAAKCCSPSPSEGYLEHPLHQSDSGLKRRKSDTCLVSDGIQTLGLDETTQTCRDREISSDFSNNSSTSSLGVEPASSHSHDDVDIEATDIDVDDLDYRYLVLERIRICLGRRRSPLPAFVDTAVDKLDANLEMSEMTEISELRPYKILSDPCDIRSDQIRRGILSMGIFPETFLKEREASDLYSALGLHFTNAFQPVAPLSSHRCYPYPPICEPVPSVSYGYNTRVFTQSQRAAMLSEINGRRLEQYAQPAKFLYWPFFTIDIRLPNEGGNPYIGHDQCAGAGSACLMAIRHLYTIASRAGYRTNPDDCMVYSLAIDGMAADLVAHWYCDVKDEYCFQVIHRYDLNILEEMQKLHQHSHNITKWALGERLQGIRNALDAIWNAQIRKTERTKTGLAAPNSSPVESRWRFFVSSLDSIYDADMILDEDGRKFQRAKTGIAPPNPSPTGSPREITILAADDIEDTTDMILDDHDYTTEEPKTEPASPNPKPTMSSWNMSLPHRPLK